jgi:hypothetical protein
VSEGTEVTDTLVGRGIAYGRTLETCRMLLARMLEVNVRIVDMYSTMEIQLRFYFVLHLSSIAL